MEKYSNNHRSGGYRRNGNSAYGSDNRPKKNPVEIVAMDVPMDYVDEAEKVMRKLGTADAGGNMKFSITTSKIRNILTLVSDIYNVENRRTDPEILDSSAAKIQMLRIRVLYEAGRDKQGVKEFVTQSHILEYIKGIGTDREKLIRFSHYMESLVAYHRFLGGRD
jgi:CRISPR-associated protein Csm2